MSISQDGGRDRYTTSGFVFVDVTAFRRLKSISKPNRIVLILIQVTKEYVAWYSIECIRRQFELWPTWGSAWLTVDASYKEFYCGRWYWWRKRLQVCKWKRTFWTFAAIFRLNCSPVQSKNWIFFIMWIWVTLLLSYGLLSRKWCSSSSWRG